MVEITRVSTGKLPAIGYDKATRTLRGRFGNGSALEYVGVGEGIWLGLKTSGSQWSYYRDNIEEELTARKISAKLSGTQRNPLDDLFK